MTFSRRAAFTLIELLASLMLAAIVLPVAMHGISVAANVAGTARRQLEAGQLAQRVMAELTTTGAWQGGELSGDFGEEWPGYAWTGQVMDYDGSALQQLEVRVTWTARGREHDVVLTTLVYAGGS